MANYTESDRLAGLKVAILITDGFEQVEMTEPRKKLDANGAETKIVSPETPRVRAWDFTNWGEDFHVDVGLHHADPTSSTRFTCPAA
jgi:protease I